MTGLNEGRMKDLQQILSSHRIVIFADVREPEKLVRTIASYNCVVKRKKLTIGDYLCSSRVCIERKQHSDFINSIINGRLFEQAKAMKEEFEIPVLIIEGSSDREINENALKAAIATLLVNFGLRTVYTRNIIDTARTIYWIAKKEQEENKFKVLFKSRKKSKILCRLQEEIVASLPGINRVLAKRLLNHFKSVENVFKASEIQLQRVYGIGKKLSRRIKIILTKRYEG